MNRSAAIADNVQTAMHTKAILNGSKTLRCSMNRSLLWVISMSPEQLSLKKRGSFLTLRMTEEGRRWRLFDQPAMVEKQDLVRQTPGLSQVVRSHDNLCAYAVNMVE